MWGGPARLNRRGLAVCALLHAAVDAGCGYLLWHATGSAGDSLPAGTSWALFVGYSVIAFGAQPLIGAILDHSVRVGFPGALRYSVPGGAMMVVAALALPRPMLLLAVGLAGLGNAIFHVAGGALALRLAPGRATAVGLFVAPGAAGLTLGVAAGRAGAPAWPFGLALGLLVALAVVNMRGDSPGPENSQRRPAGPRTTAAAGVLAPALLALLSVVAVRAYIGSGLVLTWRGQPGMLLALTAAVVVGKALGGLLGDRFGWRAVGCTALLVSAPLLLVGATHPAVGLLGLAMFNLTMPLTVAAAAAVLPGDEGLAFGLTCLALLVGSIPGFLGWAVPITPLSLIVATLAAAGVLNWALGRGGAAQPRSVETMDRREVRSRA